MSEPREPAGDPAPTPPASTWRDPWAWLAALSVLPLFLHARGAPLGEAVAEDFDFLRRALLEPHNSPWDGGGSLAYWRPVSFQLYYECLGRLILTHPSVVAAINGALLALAAVLLYRIARRTRPGPAAFAIASFPLMAESTRAIIGWSSHFVDLGAFLFSVLALHEAAHRRMWSALPALLAALLCKEVAVVTALLLPFMPASRASPSSRRRWGMASGVVLLAWGVAYAAVRLHAGLHLPHALGSVEALRATPFPLRLSWSVANSARAMMSLSPNAGPFDAGALSAVALLVVGVTLTLFLDPGARARARRARAWVAWGVVWFVLASAAITPVYPYWMPNRSQFGSLGAGVAAVAITAAAHPALAATLVIARLGLFAGSPGPPSRITPEPPDRGSFVDFPRIVRLQRLMVETRRALAARFPTLPHGAIVGGRNLPIAAAYAFGGASAIQVWYGDTTLRWLGFTDFEAHPEIPVVTFVEYQPVAARQVVLLSPAALRAQMEGVKGVTQGRWRAAITAFDRADSLQADSAAVVFYGDNAGRRAWCLAELGQVGAAESQARIALRAAREDVGARYVLALTLAHRGERARAAAELDTLLGYSPSYEGARDLYLRLRAPAGQESPKK